MDKKELKNKSKFLSLILRHKPEKIGITLDGEGWANVDTLLAALSRHSKHWSREKLEDIVKNNDKKRFYIDKKSNKIRASQGHSVNIKIKYKEVVPTDDLYHGTVLKFLGSISGHGIRKMDRHHVHLSDNVDTAEKVGARRGQPVVLIINAKQMYEDGFKFYISDNDVWLTEHVPPKYISNFPYWSLDD